MQASFSSWVFNSDFMLQGKLFNETLISNLSANEWRFLRGNMDL